MNVINVRQRGMSMKYHNSKSIRHFKSRLLKEYHIVMERTKNEVRPIIQTVKFVYGQFQPM